MIERLSKMDVLIILLEKLIKKKKDKDENDREKYSNIEKQSA